MCLDGLDQTDAFGWFLIIYGKPKDLVGSDWFRPNRSIRLVVIGLDRTVALGFRAKPKHLVGSHWFEQNRSIWLDLIGLDQTKEFGWFWLV